jgi:hypothetical protein
MRKIAVTIALAALGLPAAAHADGTPSTTDRASASQSCRIERGTTSATREAFAQKYGTNKNKKNAFGKCVSKQAVAVQKAGDEARSDASAACRTEQGTTDETQAAFADKYGTNKNKKNAFGKCVSQKAEEQEHQNAEARTGAAKACADERGTTAATQSAFFAKYGTNQNKKNAFGKCVSKQAQVQPAPVAQPGS